MEGSQGTKKKKKVHQKPFFQKLILFPFYLFLRVWYSTLRIEIDKEELDFLKKRAEPCVCVLWHNTLFTLSFYKYARRKGHNTVSLISASKDGAWLASLYELIGYKCIRGSANFRGAQSLKELIRESRKGSDIGITPDGSKGPAYIMKQGVVGVAKACRTGILLITCEHHNAWRVNSWDKFFVPKPFSKVTIRTHWIESLASMNEPDLEKATLLIQNRMLEITPRDPLFENEDRES